MENNFLQLVLWKIIIYNEQMIGSQGSGIERLKTMLSESNVNMAISISQNPARDSTCSYVATFLFPSIFFFLSTLLVHLNSIQFLFLFVLRNELICMCWKNVLEEEDEDD